MALPIITAIRQQRHLKESLLHTAVELAHLSSIYGVTRASLRYLAWKCHCSRQTIINHLKQLIALKILRKTRQRQHGRLFFEINSYTFLISWDKDRTLLPSQNVGQTLSPQGERGKQGSLTDEIRETERGLRYRTPGTEGYAVVLDKLAHLRALARA